jgi:hypothetical protein
VDRQKLREQMSERYGTRREAARAGTFERKSASFDLLLFHATGEEIAGFNDSFTLWNFVNTTWGAYSGIVNLYVFGVLAMNTGDLLRLFPTPTDFADWLSDQHEGA